MADPIAQRSGPDGWFDGSALLPWTWALERIERERNYWVSSTNADGTPHSRPMWGLWLEDLLYLTVGGHQAYRNLRDRGDAVVHVDSASEVVILEGRAFLVEDRAAMERVLAAYNLKYDWNMSPDDPGGIFAFRPRVAYGWSLDNFVPSGTRWRVPTQ